MQLGLFDFLGEGNEEVIPLEKIKQFKEIESTLDKLMLLVGLETGMALEEVLYITKGDVDPDAQTILVRNKRGSRIVYIPRWLAQDLKKFIHNRNQEVDYLFPLKENTARARIQDWTFRITGVKKGWKAVRRTYIADCASKNIPIGIVSQNSGVPADLIIGYYELTPEEKRKVLNNGST